MTSLITAQYEATGDSTKVDGLGMRPMQARAFAQRNAKFLLLKAPPASGKSRALMYIGLDKLKSGAVKKIIVAVPERSIAKSFMPTKLRTSGFHSDWEMPSRNNLCFQGEDDSSIGKVTRFQEFLTSTDTILVCTHATLRFAFDKVGAAAFSGCLIAVDELHHASASQDSRLGVLISQLIKQGDVHILAMTGSYFRGDSIPVLAPEDEAQFVKVTYNYYEQLNGYRYLKSLGIDFHFYDGRYTESIHEVLDTDKKTILHIPSVMSNESTKDKMLEVNLIISSIGTVIDTDYETGIISVQRSADNKIIRVADLVNDDPEERSKVVTFLRNCKSRDDVDLIIALGMAKEGFDWPFCEHALTVGYRNSLTEIIQIIGRCTRDCEGKTHAQFTNLVAEPDAMQADVVDAVNDILKAVTASLLMEQVLAPNFNFRARSQNGDAIDGTAPQIIQIGGFREPSTPRVRQIVESDIQDLSAEVLQDPTIRSAMLGGADPEYVNQRLVAKIIVKKYPELSPEEVEEVRQHTVTSMTVRQSTVETQQDGNRILRIANRFVDVRDLSIDLIDSINPLAVAYEVISKRLTSQVFKSVQNCIDAYHTDITEDEALFLWEDVQNFVKVNGRKPDRDSIDARERRLAEALAYLRILKRNTNNE